MIYWIRACAIVYLLAIVVPLSAAPNTGALNALTGSAPTRIVWLRGGDRLLGGGSLMAFDSRESTERQVLPAAQNQNRPILCSGGYRIIVTIDYRVNVLNWDGSGLRAITEGICSDVWIDPQTGLEWAVVRKGQNQTSGAVIRYQIDDPSQSLLLWDRTSAGDSYMNWYQVSADGRLAVDFLPWNKCFTIADGGLAPNGVETYLESGCWSSLASDNSYVWFCYPSASSGHTTLSVFRNRTRIAGALPLSSIPLPSGSSSETYHPRFASNGPLYLTLTAGYTQSANSESAEVYFGKFSADYTQIEGWARITTNNQEDYCPDAWVGVAAPSASILLEADTLRFESPQGSSAAQSQEQTITTPFASFTTVTAQSSETWLGVSVIVNQASATLANQVNPLGLPSGVHTARVNIAAAGAIPPTRTYLVEYIINGTPVADSILITPGLTTLAFNQSSTIQATVLDQHRRALNPQIPVSWATPDGGLSIGTNTFAAASTAGTYRLVATAGQISNTTFISVVPFIPVHLRVNCGDPSAGSVAGWAGDGEAVIASQAGGHFNYPTTVDVSGVAEPPPNAIYTSFRYGDHAYSFSTVPAGEYVVRLHWSDPFDDNQTRSMWVAIEGVRVLNAFNVVSAAGSKISTAVMREYQVVADNNGLQIETGSLTSEDAFLNGIEIISKGSLEKRITLLEPLGGTALTVGSVLNIRWSAQPEIAGVVISVSPDNGDTWFPITPSSIVATDPGWGAWQWTIPSSAQGISLVSNQVLIRIENYQDASIEDISPAPFQIVPGSQVTNRSGHKASNNSLRLFYSDNRPCLVGATQFKHEIVTLMGRTVVPIAVSGQQSGTLLLPRGAGMLLVRLGTPQQRSMVHPLFITR